MDEWIDVREELPHDDLQCVIWDDVGRKEVIARYDGDGEWIADDGSETLYDYEVTHWMYAPVPPDIKQHLDEFDEDIVEENDHLTARVENLTLYLDYIFENFPEFESWMREKFSGMPSYIKHRKTK